MVRTIWAVEVFVDGTWRFHSASEGLDARAEARAVAKALLGVIPCVEDARAVRFVRAVKGDR